MSSREKPAGLPHDDIERLQRWIALTARQRREIRLLRQAAAEAIVVLRCGHASRDEIAETLDQATQLAGSAAEPDDDEP